MNEIYSAARVRAPAGVVQGCRHITLLGTMLAACLCMYAVQRLGNTGGLGGAFGLLHAIGVDFPYPEGKPWQSSWQQMVSGGLAQHTVCCNSHSACTMFPYAMRQRAKLLWSGSACACCDAGHTASAL
jgi:hypothetical protein